MLQSKNKRKKAKIVEGFVAINFAIETFFNAPYSLLGMKTMLELYASIWKVRAEEEEKEEAEKWSTKLMFQT